MKRDSSVIDTPELSQSANPIKRACLTHDVTEGLEIAYLKTLLDAALKNHIEACRLVEEHRCSVYKGLSESDLRNILNDLSKEYADVRDHIPQTIPGPAQPGIRFDKCYDFASQAIGVTSGREPNETAMAIRLPSSAFH